MIQRYQRNTDVLFESIDDESVLLNLKDGCYYGLNAVGRAVWESLDRPKTIDEVISDVKLRFHEHPESVESEIYDFLEELTRPGLVECWNE